MSIEACSVPEAVARLSRRDPTLKLIGLVDMQLTDAELAELVDCLLAHPDAVTRVYLGGNQLTDETGVKLARYLAASTAIQRLNFRANRLGSATYLAMAAALRVNTSLQHLGLSRNLAADEVRIEAAFVEALRLNPDRSDESYWFLFSSTSAFERLKEEADRLGHPSLQMSLVLLC